MLRCRRNNINDLFGDSNIGNGVLRCRRNNINDLFGGNIGGGGCSVGMNRILSNILRNGRVIIGKIIANSGADSGGNSGGEIDEILQKHVS